jgi:hypothetical protein
MASPQFSIRADCSANLLDTSSYEPLINFSDVVDKKIRLLSNMDDEKTNDFVTRPEFEKFFEFYYSHLLLLHENNEKLFQENEDYKRRLSYLEVIVKKAFFENADKKSHENVAKLRDVLKLPNIEEKIDDNVIDDLDGLLEDLFIDKKNAIDLLHEVRGE